MHYRFVCTILKDGNRCVHRSIFSLLTVPPFNFYELVSVGHGKCSRDTLWASIRSETVAHARHLLAKIMDRRPLLHRPPPPSLHIRSPNSPSPRPGGARRLRIGPLLPLVHPHHLRTCLLLHLPDVSPGPEQEHRRLVSGGARAGTPHLLLLVDGSRALPRSCRCHGFDGLSYVDSCTRPVCVSHLRGLSRYLEGLFHGRFQGSVACDQAFFVFRWNGVVRYHTMFKIMECKLNVS